MPRNRSLQLRTKEGPPFIKIITKTNRFLVSLRLRTKSAHLRSGLGSLRELLRYAGSEPCVKLVHGLHSRQRSQPTLELGDACRRQEWTGNRPDPAAQFVTGRFDLLLGWSKDRSDPCCEQLK